MENRYFRYRRVGYYKDNTNYPIKFRYRKPLKHAKRVAYIALR